MTREEFIKTHSEKSEQIRHLQSELRRMKKDYIDEHKQVSQLPAKIHFIHQYKNHWKEMVIDERDAYIVGYDIIEGSYLKYAYTVYPILKESKKDGEMSLRECHYTKFGLFKFWEVGKEDTVYEIDFGE